MQQNKYVWCPQISEGIVFGEPSQMSSPPNRSQIDVKPESGFGGWADEKIKTLREAAPEDSIPGVIHNSRCDPVSPPEAS